MMQRILSSSVQIILSQSGIDLSIISKFPVRSMLNFLLRSCCMHAPTKGLTRRGAGLTVSLACMFGDVDEAAMEANTCSKSYRHLNLRSLMRAEDDSTFSDVLL